MSGLITEKLTTYLEENPATARAIFDKALAASRAREAARKARDIVRRKSALESAALPGKLGGLPVTEILTKQKFILSREIPQAVPQKAGRDRKFQAILPLWGKMLNVEKARLDKVYGNEKLMPVVTALGLRTWR